MEYTDKEIDLIRQKLIDYYGSATVLFPMATAGVIRVEQMSDDEILKEAKLLNIN
jgi:hypothetical protein